MTGTGLRMEVLCCMRSLVGTGAGSKVPGQVFQQDV